MSKILELDITLSASKPKIWRRVLVPADFTFRELHYVIQFSMGWTNSHLHQFIVGRHDRCIGMTFDDGFDDDMEMEDGRKVNISELLNAPKDKIKYEYDFGDGWEHIIEVKKVLQPETGQKYPLVTGGAMACPPEDCGGIWGYARLVETMKKKDTDEYEEMLEWLGEEFDPADFDMESINNEFFKNFKKEVKEWDDLAFG
jgi:hypothetical protein